MRTILENVTSVLLKIEQQSKFEPVAKSRALHLECNGIFMWDPATY